MRTTSIAASIGFAAVAILSGFAGAAPSLDISKKPPTGIVQPVISWTGPPGDPHATWGMWFKDKASGLEQWRTHEFHDNLPGYGGGGQGASAIKGIVTRITYQGGVPGNPILSFDVSATVANDLPGYQSWQRGSNSHSETRDPRYSYEGTMYGVKLTASFAVDTTVSPPTQWTGPYRNRAPYIVAQNNDELAWYCWTPNNPQGMAPAGAYFVPTWDFGDIPVGGSATRVMKFSIPGSGLPPTDSRYAAIKQSYETGSDIFLNRSGSLKVSDWIDELATDTGAPYPQEPPYKDSDVSVFHLSPYEPRPRDWGDAPEPGYPTKAINGGANHIIGGSLFLGASLDTEIDGQPDPNALGDDNTGVPDDEDGVVWIGPYYPGTSGNKVIVTASAGGGRLDAWIDFNNDKVWDDTAGSVEKIAANLALVAGANTVFFSVPSNAVIGQTFARFRLSSIGGLPPTGMAIDGEVEDHELFIEPEPRDWGDAPENMPPFNYPTTSTNGGACHKVQPNLNIYMGAAVDVEPDGQPDSDALGDDNNGVPDDEDGVSWDTPLMQGLNAQVTVNCTVPVGTVVYLNAWLDFGIDGSWAEPGDQIITDALVLNGANTFVFTVPATSGTGLTFARFRLSTQAGLVSGGAAPDGEVEDYKVKIKPAQDWGDAPEGAAAPTYPTRAVNNGPFHIISPGFCLGSNIDAELDGQPDPNALGDDNNPPPPAPDDEDGVIFNTGLIPGTNATITVNVTAPSGTNAYLDGWIDFNGDGNWTTPGDRIFAAQPVSNGPNVFTVAVPGTATVGAKTFARFRLSSNAAGLPFTGGATDGEVEDYPVSIGYKWVQNPDLTSTGIDVKATYPNILADDFECTVSGPITDIHIWGSWLYDEVQDPANVRFILSFHDDIPAGSGGVPYSRPGAVRWWRVFEPGQFTVSEYARVPNGEGWWDPATPNSYILPGDFIVWQYDFYMPNEGFYQQGSPEKPRIYWLDVQAIPLEGTFAEFGWKTRTLSEPHFLDDAVWGVGQEPFWGPWNELRYPLRHPKYGESVDMAFALTGYAELRDWGDAPDPSYPTLSATAGPNHKIVGGFCLGNLIDSEPDGQPDPNALGDDNNGLPDEDGVAWAPLVPGQPTTIQVMLTDTPGYPAFLDAWIDFDADGDWNESYDQIAAALPIASGWNSVTFSVPRTWQPTPRQTFARFRLTSYGGVPYYGNCSDGEVEDYAVKIGPDRGTLTFSTYVTIPDHFWWRSDPDPYNEMLGLKVGADLVEAVNWNSITLQLIGGAPGDVAQIDVWLDNNVNGVVDAGDTNIGTAITPPNPVTIALGPPALTTIPAGGSVKALISYTLSPGAAIGGVYSFQVTGATGIGATSGLPVYVTGPPISSCRKIVAPPPIKIGEAKLLPVGSAVFLQGKVCTAAFAPWNLFYIEERDRSAGIGVQFAGPISPVAQDQTVSLMGTTTLLNGTELTVVYSHIVVGPIMLPVLTPVGMNNKWTGGGVFGGQPAVYDQAFPLPGTQSVGLNNVGLLVRTWGLVTYHEPAYVTPTVSGPIFWIDDGSDLHDGFTRMLGGWTEGVACYYGFCGHPGSFPNPGEYWGVSGIMRAIPNANLIPQAVRLLVPRAFPDDLTQYPMPP